MNGLQKREVSFSHIWITDLHNKNKQFMQRNAVFFVET